MMIRLLDSMMVPVHPDACGALKKKQKTIHWTLQRRIDHQNTHNDGECGRSCGIHIKRRTSA